MRKFQMRKFQMSRIVIVFFAAALVIGSGVFANAATIDFESTLTGTYTSLTYGNLTLTDSDSSNFNITNENPGFPIFNNCLLNYDASHMRGTFTGINVYSFSIGAGDYNADADPIYLTAYDSLGTLLDSDSNTIPDHLNGGYMLNVASATPIAYVEFWSAGAYPGSLYWDNLTYGAPVPVPAAMLLLASGLAGLAGFKKRFGK